VRLLELISRMMGRETDQEDLQGKLADQTPALNK
jgi:hypothetical protein